MKNMEEYLQELRSKKVAVIGIGVSNLPLIKLLNKAGVSVTACDRKEKNELAFYADKLERHGVTLSLGKDYLTSLDEADVIFRTPGLRPDVPELLAATERGAVLTSEMEMFFDVCPAHIIAITGSDGKTTTTTLISELLKAAGKKVFLGGNIGNPLLPQVGEMTADDYAVVELSSFQLMTMRKSAPVSVVTNLSPNHLDVHKSYKEYVEAKTNIFRYQDSDGIVVLNADCEEDVRVSELAKGKIRWFSRQKSVKDGAYLSGDTVILTQNGKETPVLNVRDILLPGVHNVENYMAAIAATADHISDPAIVQKVASTFPGVPHRLEMIRESRGVRYYNDSIASSPSRTIAGLRSFSQKVILVAGGKDKGIPYDAIGPEICEHVKALYLTGMTAGKIKKAVTDTPGYNKKELPIYVFDDFEATVKAAAEKAKSGDIVLLSPASTSFDRFRNFEHRGDTFREIVKKLK